MGGTPDLTQRAARPRRAVAAACISIAVAVGAATTGQGIAARAVLAASASPTVSWTLAPSGPARFGNAAAFDPALPTLVSFAGSVQGTYPRTTLLFSTADGGSWTVLPAPTSPPRRTVPTGRIWTGMDWDPVRSRAILFGGTNGPALQDTWAFDAGTQTWTQLVANCRRVACPPARWGLGMVWSSKLQKSLVFGGVAGTTSFDDLWAFGTSWARVTPATRDRPDGRRAFAFAEDPTSGLILLYGGESADNVVYSDTWLLDPSPAGATWTRVQTTSSPENRVAAAMSWLGSKGMFVLTGGATDANDTPATSTWGFDMTTREWVPVTPSGSVPPWIGGATLTADPLDGSAILFGDSSRGWGTATETTWIVR